MLAIAHAFGLCCLLEDFHVPFGLCFFTSMDHSDYLVTQWPLLPGLFLCSKIYTTLLCNRHNIMSLRSEFCVVMSNSIIALKTMFGPTLPPVVCMFYLHCLCLFTNSGVQYILCCGFFVFYSSMLPVFLDCPFLIAASVFSNVYLLYVIFLTHHKL